MATSYYRKTPLFSFTVLLAAGLGFHSSSIAEEEAKVTPSVNFKGEAFTTMNVEMLNTYRTERYTEVVESLTASELSKDHQELVANAVAKAYLGVPVSSFTETSTRSFGDEKGPSTTKNWEVTEVGQIEGINDASVDGLFELSPFMALPPTPFVPETGKLVEETDTTAKFVFELKKPKDFGIGDREIAELSEELNWLMEITVNKADQSPKVIAMSLESPERASSDQGLEEVNVEVHYQFVKSCDCFAASKFGMTMVMSVEESVNLSLSTETTFSKVECVQPLQFLLPELDETAFLPL